MGLDVTVTGSPPPSPAQTAAVLRKYALSGMRTATALVEREYKQRASRSRRTGTALRSIHSTVSESVQVGSYALVVEGRVGTDVWYWYIVDMRGSGLYGPYNQWIVPRTASVLRFPAQPGRTYTATGGVAGFNPGGFTLAGRQRSGRAGAGAQYVYARRVRGVQARHYARDTAVAVGPQVVAALRASGAAAAQELAGMRLK